MTDGACYSKISLIYAVGQTDIDRYCPSVGVSYTILGEERTVSEPVILFYLLFTIVVFQED
jgi:hypothetical protein